MLSCDAFVTIKSNPSKLKYEDIPVDNNGVSRDEKSCTKQAESTNLFNQTATDTYCQLMRQQAAPEVDIEVFDGNFC